MAETRIRSHAISSFLQPALDGTVAAIIHTDIDWLKAGVHMYIKDGGVYEVVSISGYVYTLKLKTAEAIPGSVVAAEILYPVNHTGDGYAWGGREW